MKLFNIIPVVIIPLAALALNSCVVVDGSGAPVTPKPSATATSQAAKKPATSTVPQKVIDDCLAALRKQVGERPMKVITARMGEASYIVDVEVSDVPKPWRCTHDGTSCTGTMYMGEG